MVSRRKCIYYEILFTHTRSSIRQEFESNTIEHARTSETSRYHLHENARGYSVETPSRPLRRKSSLRDALLLPAAKLDRLTCPFASTHVGEVSRVSRDTLISAELVLCLGVNKSSIRSWVDSVIPWLHQHRDDDVFPAKGGKRRSPQRRLPLESP